MKKITMTLAKDNQDARRSTLEELADVEPTKTLYVTVTDKPKTREATQNALLQMWNRQIAEETGQSASDIHGHCKLEVLLDLKINEMDAKYCEAGIDEQYAMSFIPEYMKLRRANGIIRSKTLSVKHFAEYMKAYQLYWAENFGYTLSSNKDDELYALHGRRK